jgi:hypothetical protein
MSASPTASQPGTPRPGAQDLSGAKPPPKKPNNGWTKEQEELLAEWSDVAQGYRWMHDRSYKMYRVKNLAMSFPVIILSTITGAASVSLSGLVGDDKEANKWGQVAIGVVSIATGILQTLASRLEYAQLSEGHRVASVSWGKFQRKIAVELKLAPIDRMDSMDFITLSRQELDRLIEQSPVIPESIITKFDREFDKVKDLKQPDVCGGIEHTKVYDSKKSRMIQLTAEAALHLKLRKKLLRDDILPDLDKMIDAAVEKKRGEIAQTTEVKRKSYDLVEPIYRRASQVHITFGAGIPRSRKTSPSPRKAAEFTETVAELNQVVVSDGNTILPSMASSVDLSKK